MNKIYRKHILENKENNTAQHSTAQHCTALHVLACSHTTAPHSIALHCTAPMTAVPRGGGIAPRSMRAAAIVVLCEQCEH